MKLILLLESEIIHVLRVSKIQNKLAVLSWLVLRRERMSKTSTLTSLNCFSITAHDVQSVRQAGNCRM